MNKKVRNAIFFLIVFTLIFNNIPKPVQLNFIGGPVGGKLVVYPLLAGFLYSFWCQYKGHKVWTDWKPFSRYVAVYIGVMLLSVVIGLIQYPYYDLVLNGSVGQIEKLPWVLDKLHSHGIDVDSKLLMQAWVIVRQIKSVFMETFWCFGGAYMIYCWYRIEWKQAIGILTKAVMASSVIVIVYGVIDVMWLAHSEWAGKVLSAVNPYLHIIRDKGMWWPPLLWNDLRFRSVFAEPSYYGMFVAFALPWIWCRIYLEKSKICMVIAFLLSFMLILAKARTGFMLHLGELSLLVLFGIIFIRNREFFKKALPIIGISLCAFILGNLFIVQYIDKKPETKAVVAIEQYVDSNAKSVASSDARSNKSRYSVMEADFRVGLDHPILGVGKGLRSSYVPDYFSEKAKLVGEIKMWLEFRERLGVMRSGIPSLGAYTSLFAEAGIIGLGVFLCPIIVILVWAVKRFIRRDYDMWMVFFLISFCGMLAAGIGDTINITYCLWVLLGVGYAMIYGNPTNDEKDINESA